MSGRPLGQAWAHLPCDGPAPGVKMPGGLSFPTAWRPSSNRAGGPAASHTRRRSQWLQETEAFSGNRCAPPREGGREHGWSLKWFPCAKRTRDVVPPVVDASSLTQGEGSGSGSELRDQVGPACCKMCCLKGLAFWVSLPPSQNGSQVQVKHSLWDSVGGPVSEDLPGVSECVSDGVDEAGGPRKPDAASKQHLVTCRLH